MSSANRLSWRVAVRSKESSKETKTASPCPPRLCALRRRAASTSNWRIARAAMRLKCRREVAAIPGCFASFSHASFTNAVGLRVLLGSPRLTLEARRRNSS